MAVFAFAYGKEGLEEAFKSTNPEHVIDSNAAFFNAIIALGGIGIGIGIAWSLAMAFMASWFINLALAFTIVLCFTTGGLLSWQLSEAGSASVGGSYAATWFWVPAVGFGLMGLGLMFYMCMVQKRIAFASANLRVAAKGIISCWGVYVTAVMAAGVQVMWFALWLTATYGVTNHFKLEARVLGTAALPGGWTPRAPVSRSAAPIHAAPTLLPPPPTLLPPSPTRLCAG